MHFFFARSVHDDGVEAVEPVERQLEPGTPLLLLRRRRQRRRRRLAADQSPLLLGVRRRRRGAGDDGQVLDGGRRRAVGVQRRLAEDHRRQEPLHRHGSSSAAASSATCCSRKEFTSSDDDRTLAWLTCVVIEIHCCWGRFYRVAFGIGARGGTDNVRGFTGVQEDGAFIEEYSKIQQGSNSYKPVPQFQLRKQESVNMLQHYLSDLDVSFNP